MNLIVCKKEECRGIHAEIVGDRLIQVVKRKMDKHPVFMKITGSDYNLISSCTLCGTEQLIEAEDGKILVDDLKIIEVKEDDNDGEELKQQEDDEGKGGEDNGSGSGSGQGGDGGDDDSENS